MAMWKYLKRYDEKIFENIFFEILSLPYFRKFSHLKISTYTVLIALFLVVLFQQMIMKLKILLVNLMSTSRLIIVSCEAKKKQQPLSELFTWTTTKKTRKRSSQAAMKASA